MSSVTFREDHIALRDGKPWFPIGAWGLPRCNDPMRALADAGFNLVIDKQARVPDDERLAHIMGAGRCDSDFTTLARTMRDKPEFIGWVVDEPSWNKTPLDNIKGAYQAIRENAPGLILWQTQAPQNSVAGLSEYYEYCDVCGVNIYPVGHPTHSSLPNRTRGVVADEVRKQREATNGGKPIWAVLQGFDWSNMQPRPPNEDLRQPTWDDVQFMAHAAIHAGATGIIYFGLHHEPPDSVMWNFVKRMAGELARRPLRWR